MKRIIDLSKKPVFDLKPLVVKPHPRQTDIDLFRALPSLFTGRKPLTLERARNEPKTNMASNNQPAGSKSISS
jgi:hypothetical protein